MDYQTIMIVASFIVLSSLAMGVYYLLNKKSFEKHAQVAWDEKEKRQQMLQDPNVARVALWVDIDEVKQGVSTDFLEYETNIKYMPSGKLKVGLFYPGDYQFIVSSHSNHNYQGVKVEVKLQPGVTYQLGCNDGGIYIVPDRDPNRYAFRR